MGICFDESSCHLWWCQLRLWNQFLLFVIRQLLNFLASTSFSSSTRSGSQHGVDIVFPFFAAQSSRPTHVHCLLNQFTEPKICQGSPSLLADATSFMHKWRRLVHICNVKNFTLASTARLNFPYLSFALDSMAHDVRPACVPSHTSPNFAHPTWPIELLQKALQQSLRIQIKILPPFMWQVLGLNIFGYIEWAWLTKFFKF